MVLMVLLGKLKAVFLLLIGLVKKSLCCLRRRRRSSVDSAPLTQVIGGPPKYDPSQTQEMESWYRWGDGSDRPPQTVQEHIEEYRRMARQQSQHSQDQPDEDFFQDMVPDIKKQPKVLLKTREMESDVPSRLTFIPDSFPTNVGSGGELGAWEEYEGGTWGPETSENEVLREKRREEQKRRALERDHKRATTLASRVS